MSDFTITKQHASFGGKQLFCTHDSAVLGCKMNFAVYLPPLAELADCPVLWFLSGLTCTEENFMTKSGVQQHAAQHNMIVISPDTSPRGTNTAGEDESYALGTGAGFYIDATHDPWSTHYQMYSYITQELQTLIANNFPIKADRQAITGFSMGGHGALVLGLRNPNIYSSISALAPICAPTQSPWGKNALDVYLGANSADQRDYDAVQIIANGATCAELLIDQGGEDEFLQTELRPDLLQEACAKVGQPLNYRLHEGYDHSFYFVASVMADHVAFHAERLSK